MSTTILETETFSITRFFGGRYRGVCYQINVAGSPGYVQLTRDEAVLLRSALTDELFGDPSEATPTKENAPPERERFMRGGQEYWIKTYAETADQIKAATFVGTDKFVLTDTQEIPAPAPEVQGTPTKEDPVRRDREGWEAGVRAAIMRLEEEIEEWEAESKQGDISEQVAKFIRQRIAQTNVHIWQIRELRYPGAKENFSHPCEHGVHPEECDSCRPSTIRVEPSIWSWPPTSDPVQSPVGTPQKETPPTMPFAVAAQIFGASREGVQGKEPPLDPQDESHLKIWEAACDCCRIDGSPRFANGKWTHFYDDGQTLDCTAGPAFSLGEAAGRRSAITACKERAELARDAAALICHPSSRAEAFQEVIAWCVELQEKTK